MHSVFFLINYFKCTTLSFLFTCFAVYNNHIFSWFGGKFYRRSQNITVGFIYVQESNYVFRLHEKSCELTDFNMNQNNSILTNCQCNGQLFCTIK